MDTFLNVAVDRTYYKRFKDEMMGWMRQETIESVNDVFRNGSSALNLLKADHVFVNYRLAKWYGIKGVNYSGGDQFRKVKIDESKIPRGGLLTQGSALVAGSDGINSHAILRGVWLQKLILNTPPPEPPADVPDLNEENIPGFDKLTLNQKLEIHRNNEACASCHARIDPYGIPFENFDASGAWRENVLTFGKATDEENIKMRAEEVQREEDEEKRKKIAKKIRNKEYMAPRYLPIERKSILPSNKSIDGIQELKAHILNHRKGDFARGLVQKILSYAYSRDITFYDEELLDELTDYFMKNGYSVPSLINQIVITDEFLKGVH
jgi:disulfide oxidoreductase YuzD